MVQQLHIAVVLLHLLQLMVTAEQLVVQLAHAVHNMDCMKILNRNKILYMKIILLSIVVEVQLLIVVLYLMAIVVIQHVELVFAVHDTDSMLLIKIVFFL